MGARSGVEHGADSAGDGRVGRAAAAESRVLMVKQLAEAAG